MESKIKVLAIRPAQKPEVVEIDNELETFQSFVGGYIQVIYPWEDEVGIICNDEGKFCGAELNRALRNDEGKVYDIIAGDFLIAGLDGEDFGSLSDEQIKRYSKRFAVPEQFVKVDDKLLILPIF